MKKKADLKTKRSNASALHRTVLSLCKKAFPSMSVMEELTIDTDEGKLYVDLYIKELNVCIECHGRQHDEYVPHFHGTKEGFRASKARDASKLRTLQDSGYTVVEVRESNLPMTPTDLYGTILRSIKA